MFRHTSEHKYLNAWLFECNFVVINIFSNLYKSQLKTATDLEEKLDKIKKNNKKEQKYCNDRRNSKDSEYQKSSKNNGQLSSNGNNFTSETVIYIIVNNLLPSYNHIGRRVNIIIIVISLLY